MCEFGENEGGKHNAATCSQPSGSEVVFPLVGHVSDVQHAGAGPRTPCELEMR